MTETEPLIETSLRHLEKATDLLLSGLPPVIPLEVRAAAAQANALVALVYYLMAKDAG